MEENVARKREECLEAILFGGRLMLHHMNVLVALDPGNLELRRAQRRMLEFFEA
jgi:hypothetical protein